MRLRDVLLLAALLPPCAQARELSAFSILRLDMPTTPVATPAPGRWTLDAEAGYQNTWSMSPNVRDYFETRGYDRSLTPADIADIAALPFEKFLVDLELGTVEVTARRGITPEWSAWATLSAVSYQGGFLDAAIEGFHDALGFKEFVRYAVPRNGFAILAGTGSTQSARTEAPSGGLLDPVLGVRYAWSRYAIDAAVKVPLGGTRAYLSNGHADFGVQGSVHGSWGKHAAWGLLSGVSTKSAGIVVETHKRHFVPTASARYEYAMDAATRLYVHAQVSVHALDRSDTGIDGLHRPLWQAGFGLRHRLADSEWRIGLVEYAGAYNGQPDLGFQAGWTFELR